MTKVSVNLTSFFFIVVMGHSICFYWKFGRVGFILSSIPNLIWSSAVENDLFFYKNSGFGKLERSHYVVWVYSRTSVA